MADEEKPRVSKVTFRFSFRLVLTSLLFLGCGLDFIGHAETISLFKVTAATPAGVEYNKGVDSFAAGDLAQAEAQFQKSLKLDPRMVNSLLGLSEIAHRKGKNDEAGAYLQKALSLSPEQPEIHRAWARYLFVKKDYRGAESALQKALSLDARFVGALIDLGDLNLTRLDAPQKAIENYRAALSIEPNNAGAHYALGTALVQVQKLDLAEGEFKKASEEERTNILPIMALGQLYASRGETDKALAVYEEHIKVQPKALQLYIAKGDLLSSKGQDSRAIETYNQAIKQDPKAAIAHLKVGMVLQKTGRLTEAENEYRLSIQSDPRQAIAYNNLAWIAAERKTNLNEAMTWANKAVQLNPQVAGFHGTLGWVYRAAGQNDKAVLSLEKAASLAPSQPEILYHLGMVYAETGKTQRAVETLKKAVSISNFPEANEAKSLLAKLTNTAPSAPQAAPKRP
jgi:tetratricopeptide (TPR) repeat protein